MNIYFNSNDFKGYIKNQYNSIEKLIGVIDSDWEYGGSIKKMLEKAKTEILKFNILDDLDINGEKHERKIEKYLDWIEVYRLANYHFSKYMSNSTSYSEGLFSTLLALSNMYIHNKNIKKIGIIGCGPGRSVLDFSYAYPNATIYGLDYSIVSLILARDIVSSNDKNIEIVKRDYDNNNNEKIIINKMSGFNRKNCKWGMFDLSKSELSEKFDIVVCSNVINLMPNHKESIDKIYSMIKPNGYLIYADLIGWRLDRTKKQSLLCDKSSIKTNFENVGFKTIECFEGGPYVETENTSHFTFYKEIFYMGKKVG